MRRSNRAFTLMAVGEKIGTMDPLGRTNVDVYDAAGPQLGSGCGGFESGDCWVSDQIKAAAGSEPFSCPISETSW